MVDEGDRLLAAAAAETRVQVGAVRPDFCGVQYLGFNALAIQNRLQESSAEELVAGRVGGVDAKVVGEDGLGLAGECVPIDRTRLRAQRRRHQKQRRNAGGSKTIHWLEGTSLSVDCSRLAEGKGEVAAVTQ